MLHPGVGTCCGVCGGFSPVGVGPHPTPPHPTVLICGVVMWGLLLWGSKLKKNVHFFSRKFLSLKFIQKFKDQKWVWVLKWGYLLLFFIKKPRCYNLKSIKSKIFFKKHECFSSDPHKTPQKYEISDPHKTTPPHCGVCGVGVKKPHPTPTLKFDNVPTPG